MVWVADDLAGWLLEQLADAGRRKLTDLILGDELERALRQAATVAVQVTAEELSGGDKTRAQVLAMAISERFAAEVPVAASAQATVLEGLRAGIAGQLAVLEDRGLTTAPGQSWADAAGVAAGVLAPQLTAALLSQILSRAARGGPLVPLAAQLNADMGHMGELQTRDLVRQQSAELLEAITRIGQLSALPAGDVFMPPTVTVFPASADRRGGGVARYLRPEAGVVRFWPRPELEELATWMADDGPTGVRLVTGAGGSGKTRLALELGKRVTGLSWRSWWVPAGQEADAVRAASAGGEPALLVADYAETREGLAAMLAAVAAAQGGARLRILLLARSAGEWWQRLLDGLPDDVSDLAVGHAPVMLGPVAATPDQAAVFAEALAAFAELRGIPCPDARPWAADPDAVVLVVHAAALLAVLDAEAGTGGSGVAGGEALAGVLRHERRYWQQTLERRVPGGLDPDVIDRIVAAGCLIGADDQEAAMRLLAAVSDLAGDGRLRGQVARWLRDLYPAPAGGPEWLGQLQPDLLTEQLAVTVLVAHPELITRLFAGTGEARTVRALTILGRAALTQPAALPQIRQALEVDPEHLLVPAIVVTTATNPAVAPLIMSVHAAAVLPAEALVTLAEAIPHPTVALVRWPRTFTGSVMLL